MSVKMVRYYESIGLVPRASRTQGGYRLYTENDAHQLVFIRRARALGFTIDEIGKLLALWRNKRRASAEVKRLALSHIAALEEKIAELEAMRHPRRNEVFRDVGGALRDKDEDDYVEAVDWAQRFARENRALMMRATLAALRTVLGDFVVDASGTPEAWAKNRRIEIQLTNR
mgnify:CR=1 FL=1